MVHAAARCGLAALLIAFATAGCKSEPPAPVETRAVDPGPNAPVPVAPKPAAPKPAEAVPLAPTLTEAAARAVVDRWLAAQNAGDFAAYEATYAPRFFGVKRAGPRTSRFDRAGWLKDRRRMFQKPMTVTAEDIRITPGPGTARVVFTQTWASGDYRDTGPKQLVLSLHEKRAVIAREEMMRSTVLGPAPAAESGADLRFVHMLDAPYVVLGDAAGTDDLGEPTLLARGRAHVVRAPGPKNEPHVGRAVTLYSPNGRRCGGTIAEVVVLGVVIPHFGAVQTWNGEMDDSGEKATDAQIAGSVWAMSSEGGRVLAGRLDMSANDCAGAVFARLEGPEAPVAAVWAPGPVPPADKNAALAIMRASAPWRAMQAAFTDVEEGQGPWDASGVAKAITRGFTSPGGQRLIVIDLDAGLGCGGFGGGLWQAFTVEDGEVQPVGSPSTTAFVPAAALDVGGPLPALIGVEGYAGDRAVHSPKDGAFVPTSTLPVLDLDCPC